MTTPSTASPRLPWDAVDPYPFYERRRHDGGVVWDETTNAWLTLSFHAARQVLVGPGWTSNPAANPNARAAMASLGPDLSGRSMLFTDGPSHTRLRSSVRDVFTRTFVTGLRAGVEAIAASVIDHIATGEDFDFMAEIAQPLPIAVVGEWLGLDATTSRMLREQSPAIMRMLSALADTDEIAAGTAAAATLITQFLPLAADRRSHPGDDLLSFIAADRDLNLDEVVLTAILIGVAGHETTANLLGSGMVRLLSVAPDGTRLTYRLDPEDPSLTTELLRLDGPVQAVARTAVVDHVVGVVEIACGQPVLAVIAAANRDPAVFHQPDQFRLGRSGPAPLSFGYGAHFCLGASLARLEITAALQHILRRRPSLAGPPIWRDVPAIRGPVSIPMVFQQP